MSHFLTDKDKIALWLDSMDVRKYTINLDSTVDVNHHVFLSDKNLSKLPIQFNNVYGDFDISYNPIRDLKGCPKFVKKSFYAFQCELKSLEGAPLHVGNHFQVHINKIKSLEHFPQTVLGEIDISENEISSMQHLPNTVQSLYAACNYIENFNGLPLNIRGSLTIFDNNISSFEGITKNHRIEGYIDCDFITNDKDAKKAFHEFVNQIEYKDISSNVKLSKQQKAKNRL